MISLLLDFLYGLGAFAVVGVVLAALVFFWTEYWSGPRWLVVTQTIFRWTVFILLFILACLSVGHGCRGAS
jgi:hypothetical protein